MAAEEEEALTVIRSLNIDPVSNTIYMIVHAYLSRSLEVEPLIFLEGMFRSGGEMNLVFFVVSLGKVLDDRVRLPENKVSVIVVNNSWDTCSKPLNDTLI